MATTAHKLPLHPMAATGGIAISNRCLNGATRQTWTKSSALPRSLLATRFGKPSPAATAVAMEKTRQHAGSRARIKNALMEQEELARTLTREEGKTLKDSVGEVQIRQHPRNSRRSRRLGADSAGELPKTLRSSRARGGSYPPWGFSPAARVATALKVTATPWC